MSYNYRYYSLSGPSRIVYKEKGSKFIAIGFPLETAEEFTKKYKAIKEEFPDATHHCYALILNPDKSFQKSSDDGEPSNSAGKPILRAILSSELTNTAIVVVRYFGGTQLGIPGLVQAYFSAAEQAIRAGSIETKTVKDHYELSCDFKYEPEAYRFLKKLNAKIIVSNSDEKIFIEFEIERDKKELLEKLREEFYFLEVNLK